MGLGKGENRQEHALRVRREVPGNLTEGSCLTGVVCNILRLPQFSDALRVWNFLSLVTFPPFSSCAKDMLLFYKQINASHLGIEVLIYF